MPQFTVAPLGRCLSLPSPIAMLKTACWETVWIVTGAEGLAVVMIWRWQVMKGEDGRERRAELGGLLIPVMPVIAAVIVIVILTDGGFHVAASCATTAGQAVV